MRLLTLSFAAIVALCSAYAQDPVKVSPDHYKAAGTPNPIHGTWKLLSYTRTVVSTGETSDVYGPKPNGYLNYGPDGRMYAILGESVRPKPKDLAKVTDEERLKLYRTFSSYAGTFTVSGNTVTHHVDISFNETWTGTDLVRKFELRGDTLIIKLEPQPNQVDGQIWTSELKWVKVKPKK